MPRLASGCSYFPPSGPPRLMTPEEHNGSQAFLGGQDTSLHPSFILTDSGLRKKDTAAFQTVSYTEKTKTGI